MAILHAFCSFLSIKFFPLLYALVGFGLLIAVHECGHFVFCKIFNIHTPTFSIGFGPELFRKKIGKTNFRLALIPFGGYVEIAGLEETGQGSQDFALAKDETSFSQKPYWQKVCVLSGGVLFNVIFAYLVFCLLFMVGSPKPHSISIAGIMKESAAEKAGLKTGDGILKINDKRLQTNNQELIDDAYEVLLGEIRQNPDKQVIFSILRDGKTQEFPVVLGHKEESGKTIGSLGTEMRAPVKKLSFFAAFKAGAQTTALWIVRMIQGIKQLFCQRSLEGAGGPVMIIAQSFSSAQSGIIPLLIFLALISLNLALINILPLGILDGGKILMITIEAIIRRELPRAFKNGLEMITLFMFISFFLLITYRDIVSLFGAKLKVLYLKIMGALR